jgi:hypothetical protein
MVRALTKCDKNGFHYTRPQTIEKEIEGALQEDLPTLRRRLLVTDTVSPEYLRSESLVHLIRDALHRGDDQRLNATLIVLLGRCETILKAKIADRLPNADKLREEVLSGFSELLASDGTGDQPDELDFYECKFNLAFRTLRIDVVRRELKQVNRSAELPAPEYEGVSDAYKDAFIRVHETFRTPATQQNKLFLKELWEAINALPPDERKAVILCHLIGYKEESENPDEVTAATCCNCTGRTIRNRLSRAAANLSRFKEVV